MTDQSSLWPLRLLALGIAFSLWLAWAFVPRLQEVAEPPVEANVAALVTYPELEGMTLLNPIDQVTVRVRGTQEVVSRLTASDIRVRLTVPQEEIASQLGTNYRGPVNRETFLESSNVAAPSGLDIVAITPDRVSLLIDELVTRQVPVDPQFVGEPSAGSRLIRAKSYVEPSEVYVRGPRSEVETLATVQAGPISLNGHAISFPAQVRAYSEVEQVKVERPTIVKVWVELEVSGVEPQSTGMLLRSDP